MYVLQLFFNFHFLCVFVSCKGLGFFCLFYLFIGGGGRGLELQFPPITKTSRQAASPLPPLSP